MAHQPASRTLAAVLSADIVGFSRLMELAEEPTYHALDRLKRELWAPHLARFRARIVGTAGDSLLIAFASAVDAVRCAIQVQRWIAGNRPRIGESRPIVYRIGVNVGDVIDDGETLYGDAVNIAVRLEGIAKPGGIAVSGRAWDAAAEQVDAMFVHRGAVAVKNIVQPVSVWDWIPADGSATPLSDQISAWPVVAVLPFRHDVDGERTDYLADGIAETLIGQIANWRYIPVIARNSSFSFRDESIDMALIGRMLGARYLLQGAIQRSGPRIRVHCSLVDARTRSSLWTNHFDRDLADLFALQDDIAGEIVRAIHPAIHRAEIQRALRKPTESLDAWDCVLRGLWHRNHYRRSENESAHRMFASAVEKDANFALAHALISSCHYADTYLGWSSDPRASMQAADRAARMAISLDDMLADGHVQATYVNLTLRNFEMARYEGAAARELNPGHAYSVFADGLVQLYTGDPQAALAAFATTWRLSPRDPLLWLMHVARGLALYGCERYAEAIEAGEQASMAKYGLAGGQVLIAAAQARLGDNAAAAQAMRRLIEAVADPIRHVKLHMPYQNADDLRNLTEGLTRAGKAL